VRRVPSRASSTHDPADSFDQTVLGSERSRSHRLKPYEAASGSRPRCACSSLRATGVDSVRRRAASHAPASVAGTAPARPFAARPGCPPRSARAAKATASPASLAVTATVAASRPALSRSEAACQRQSTRSRVAAMRARVSASPRRDARWNPSAGSARSGASQMAAPITARPMMRLAATAHSAASSERCWLVAANVI
jgi:hypothetical protein